MGVDTIGMVGFFGVARVGHESRRLGLSGLRLGGGLVGDAAAVAASPYAATGKSFEAAAWRRFATL